MRYCDILAAEALDIKTLCTLIMVTPKTDIEQSVGRILRSDHDQPVVVDIVDSHDSFVKQWAKRKTFYRKENYEIVKTTFSTYKGTDTAWETVYVPKVIAGKSAATKDESDPEEDQIERKCLINLEEMEEIED